MLYTSLLQCVILSDHFGKVKKWQESKFHSIKWITEMIKEKKEII